MGDRCYLEMVFLKSDADKVREVFGLDKDYKFDKDAGNRLTFVDEEANYGLLSERGGVLAEAGVMFLGSHGAGGDYGGCKFVAVDGQLYEAEQTINGYLFVRVDADGFPVNPDLDAVQEYLKMFHKVEELFGITRGN